jgi:hypothetical protein
MKSCGRVCQTVSLSLWLYHRCPLSWSYTRFPIAHFLNSQPCHYLKPIRDIQSSSPSSLCYCVVCLFIFMHGIKYLTLMCYPCHMYCVYISSGRSRLKWGRTHFLGGSMVWFLLQHIGCSHSYSVHPAQCNMDMFSLLTRWYSALHQTLEEEW